MKITSKASVTKRLNLKYDELLSTSAFNFNSRRYIVGLLTNWIALKCIFEPVDPYYLFGRFKIQGLFLQRQAEVSGEFSDHLATKVGFRIQGLRFSVHRFRDNLATKVWQYSLNLGSPPLDLVLEP